MVETAVLEMENDLGAESTSRVYEIGYHVTPTTKEEEVEKIVSEIRAMIEQAGGKLLAEGAPSLMKLAYLISGKENGKRADYDRGYFGWIKFEAPSEAAAMLETALKNHAAIMRSIVFRTVREETRARFKTATLREVKRTDTLKQAPRTTEEVAAPVSEEDLEKAIEGITAE
ncbi:MAG TPA: 30S ribosomal protein S6 [Candidatus Paceibacterota bacterium]|nr:30S ribosomal protein S6 [Candidatus Paceibacterota bacterium]